MSPIDNSTVISLSKIRKLFKEKGFLPWCCPKRFIVLSVLITIAAIQQIRSRVIETSENGPFGHVVEASSL